MKFQAIFFLKKKKKNNNNNNNDTLDPLYKTIHYKMVEMWTRKLLYPNKKCIDYIEKWPFKVTFLYNLDIFV